VIVRQVTIPADRIDIDSKTELGAREESVVVPWQFGTNRETAFLVGGLALLGWSLTGGLVFYPRLFRKVGLDEPAIEMSGQAEKVRLADGSELNVETVGPPDADTIVLIHGWSLDNHEWCYAKKSLARQFRVITWDLPGLGKSDRPVDRDWSLEKLAAILDIVISKAQRKPVAIVAHSIGVMIALTYCKVFPGALGTRVRALVLAHGTYTNPVRTTKSAALYTALEKPLIVPLCHLMVWLSPLVRVMNWLGYLNGSVHRSTERVSFSGQEARGQLDFLPRLFTKAAPDVVARGMLAMLRYDATSTLANIPIPTLIVTGDKDETCLPAASHFMADRIPAAQLMVLNRSKHCGLFEYPVEFNQAVADFLLAHSMVGPGNTPADEPNLPSGSNKKII
jgi:pimeloyl-ACP methyl ester carboxylesterase